MFKSKTLIFIPTYNEFENVGKLYQGIARLGLKADILFMDDNSPDGTGKLLDSLSREHHDVAVIHRAGKLGIGSAHLEGIAYAYRQGYDLLVTMDCDFTHSPDDIHRILEHENLYDVVVASRYMDKESLKGWNILRKTLTYLGHFLTRVCLGMPYDATGAFRLYRLKRSPRDIFMTVQSKGYSFFFENLYVLYLNKFKIKEIPIVLPPRVYGHSKMTYQEIWHSFKQLVNTYWMTLKNRKAYLLEPSLDENRDLQGWNQYWGEREETKKTCYDTLAEFYRKNIIRPSLNFFIHKYFSKGARLLHAGCGSGQVDVDIAKDFSITALDYSPAAIKFYERTNPRGQTILGSIFDIPIEENSCDGVYNLGVMEHFTGEEIQKALREFKRVVKPDGKIVLFWPHEFGGSVMVLKAAHFFLNKVLGKNIKLHPDEISRLRSAREAKRIIEQAGLKFEDHYFGIRDLFTQMVVIAKKNS